MTTPTNTPRNGRKMRHNASEVCLGCALPCPRDEHNPQCVMKRNDGTRYILHESCLSKRTEDSYLVAKRYENQWIVLPDEPKDQHWLERPPLTPAQVAARESAQGLNERVVEQAPPQANDHPAVWGLVMKDMVDRDQEGRRKYGVPLQGFNGRDCLIDAYQEALDLCVYLRQAIYERDKK